jgi:hypothetical protein
VIRGTLPLTQMLFSPLRRCLTTWLLVVVAMTLVAQIPPPRPRGQRGPSDDRTFTLGTNGMIFRPTRGCIAQKTDDLLEISGEGELRSEQTFTPPFTIHAIARTDVTNIRLYWGTSVVIFNWELNPRELRFHDPAGGVHGFNGRGFVTVNDWHEIEWVVNPDSNYIIVDFEERAFVRSNNTGVTNAVGIGAARGSIVDVKALEVRQVSRLPSSSNGKIEKR